MAKKAPSTSSSPLWQTPLPPDVPGAWFDQAAVDRVVKALKALRHTKGKWAGHPFELETWQLEYLVAPVFGWKHPDGSRIIRTAHDEEHIEAWAFDAQSIRTVTQPGLVRKIVKRKDPETRREVWVRLEGADLIAARHREVSIVVRRAILDLLPSKLVEDAMRACELAIEKSARKEFESGPIVPLADLLEGWWSQGVREEHLVRYCGKPLAELKPAEIAKLSGMLRGVREGSISVAPFLRSPEVEVVQPPEVVTTPKAAPIEHVEPPAPARPLSPPAPARPITPDDLSDDAWGASPSPIEVPAKDVPF